MKVLVLLLIITFSVCTLVIHTESTLTKSKGGTLKKYQSKSSRGSTSEKNGSKSCVCLSPIQPCDKDIRKGIKKAAYFILDNAENFKTSKYKKNIMVIGDPESEKTALIKVLTMDNSKLTSIDIGGNFVIVDPDCSHDPTEDFIPVLYEESSVKIAWYDTPSLEEHTISEIDFSAAFFIKKTFDEIEDSKILITIPHYKILSTSYKAENLKIITHLAKLMGEYIVDDDDSNLGLVITNVNNYDDSDDNLKLDIAKYIISLKELICERCLTKTEIENLYTIIGIITSPNKHLDYDRIGLFKKPTQVGTLNLDNPFQDAKRKLRKLIDKISCISIPSDETDYVVFDKTFHEKCTRAIEKSFDFINYFLDFFGFNITEE